MNRLTINLNLYSFENWNIPVFNSHQAGLLKCSPGQVFGFFFKWKQRLLHRNLKPANKTEKKITKTKQTEKCPHLVYKVHSPKSHQNIREGFAVLKTQLSSIHFPLFSKSLLTSLHTLNVTKVWACVTLEEHCLPLSLPIWNQRETAC